MSKDYIGSYTLQDFNDTTFFAEYSATGLEGSWHSSFQTGDLFMRTKTGENSWSQAIRIVGEDGAQGEQGIQGPAGENGQPTYTWIRYADTPTTGMSDSPAGKPYIGIAHNKLTATESSAYSDYVWSLIKGEKGDTGEQGKGILSTAIHYQASSSGTVAPTDTWTTTIPSVLPDEYLWTRTIITYTDSQETIAYSVGKMGAQGPQGDAGVAGIGIDSTVVTYQASSSGTVTPTGTWSATIPTVADNQYLWTKIVINYTDLTSSTSYSIGKMGAQGPQGAKGDTGSQGPQGATGEQGPKGDTGVGVSSVTEYYLATSATTGVTTATEGWDTTMQPMTTTKKYLWNYEVINFSDGSSSPTLPVIIGVYGNTGATGRALTGVVEYYLASASASGVTRPATDGTNGWTIAMQTTSIDKPYLWNYEKLTWSVAPTTSYIEPIVIGVHGATGPQGPAGRSITDVDVEYYLSTSSTSLAGGSWSTTAPDWVDGRFMWSKTVTTYSTGNPTESTPVCITGAKGATGNTGGTGATGRGVASIDAEFYLSSSKTTQTGGSWSTTMPSWSPGMYVWTRSLITYTSGTPAQETTTPLVSSEWEAINKIEIGGRNYFSASQLKGLEPNNTTNTLETSETGLAYVKEVTAGEVYTLSRSSITVGAKFGYVFTIDEPGDGVACTTYVGDYEDDLVVAGITIPATYNYIVIYLTSEGETLPNVKLESGNQATDWTMSQEDLEKYLSDNEVAAAEAKDYADQALSQLEQIQSAYTIFLEQDVGYVRCDVNGTPLDNSPLITNSIRIFKGVQELVPVALGEETVGSFSIEIPVNDDLENNTYQINCEGSKIAGSNNSFTVDSVVNDFDTGSLLINIYVEGKTGTIPTFEKIFSWSKNINTNILPTSKPLEPDLKIGDLYETTDINDVDKKLIFRFNGEEWEDVTKFSNFQGEELINKIGSFIIEENDEYVLNIINFFGDINAYAGEEITLTGEKIFISGELLARSMKATDFAIVNNEEVTTFAVSTSGDVSMIGTINSMNYLLSQTGWKISENGDSEFNDTVVRGKLLLPNAGVVNDYDPNQTDGRNLVLNSDSLISNSNYLVATYLLSEDIVEGETYTISLKGTRVAGQEFELFQNGGATSKGTILLEEDDVYSLTFVASVATSGYEREIRVYQSPELTAGLAEIEWIKMEKGDSITNWLPAPEDDSDPVRIYAGSTYETRNSAPFRVTQSGNLHAEQGVFSGLFTGRFALGDIEITDDNGEVDGLAEIRFIHDDDVTTTYPILISATSGSHFNIPFFIGAEDDPRFLVRSNEVLVKTHELRISQNEDSGIASKDVVFPNSDTDKLIKFNDHSHNIDVIDNELLFNANSNPTNYHFKFQHNTGGSIKALIDGSLEINNYIGYEKLKIVKKTDVGNSGIDFTFE